MGHVPDEYPGLTVSVFFSRKPNRLERRFGEWAALRGLFVYIGEQDGEVSVDLGVEEFIDDQYHAYWIAMVYPLPKWPEMWEHYEKLLRAGFERYKQEKLTYPWWEHVP